MKFRDWELEIIWDLAFEVWDLNFKNHPLGYPSANQLLSQFAEGRLFQSVGAYFMNANQPIKFGFIKINIESLFRRE